MAKMPSVLFNNDGLNVEYSRQFYSKSNADDVLVKLEQLSYFTPCFNIRGKTYKPARKILAYGDDGTSYAFSGTQVVALPWTPLMQSLRDDVERVTGYAYNFVLLNLYPDGKAKISDHKDLESSLNVDIPISVLSFGATRTIEFKKPQAKTTSIPLEHGSLYMMYSPTNQQFTHGIPAEPEVTSLRISLTFRKILESSPFSKKIKLEIPSSEWLEKLYQQPQPSLVNMWNLKWGTYVTLHIATNGLCLHVREFTQNAQLEHFPTNNGIIMNVATWYQLQQKLFDFNTQYNDASQICNNQLVLINNEGSCVLQQIFKQMDREGFVFKPSILKLSYEQLEKLKVFVPHINNCILETLFEMTLVELLTGECTQCVQSIHDEDRDVAEDHLMCTIIEEVRQCLQDNFKCVGCIIDHPGLLQHDCLNLGEAAKYRSLSDNVLMFVNMRAVAAELKKKHCVCLYTSDFFKSFSLKKYLNYIESQLMDDY